MRRSVTVCDVSFINYIQFEQYSSPSSSSQILPHSSFIFPHLSFLCAWELGSIITQTKSFLILVIFYQIWIVIAHFRLIWHQTNFRLLPNKSINTLCFVFVQETELCDKFYVCRFKGDGNKYSLDVRTCKNGLMFSYEKRACVKSG